VLSLPIVSHFLRRAGAASDENALDPDPCMSALPASHYVLPVLLLCASNVFMTVAWYGHLDFKSAPLWIVILVSWGIALIEYGLAVPANRLGHQVYSAAELKVMQEVITLTVFAGFSALYLREPMTLSHLVGFLLIIGGAFFVFQKPLG
jgi:uncharacterized protein (DUF486 family)